MKLINQKLLQIVELSHDVPVTKKIVKQAGVFLTVILLLFAAHSRNAYNLIANGHLTDKSNIHNTALAHKDHPGLKKF